MKKNKIKNKKGFTLVELLVSVFVFSLIVGAIMGIFVSGIETQKQILKDQKVISELSYVMEYMSRFLRMAIRDESGDCIDSGYNYQLINGEKSGIRFLNYENKCQEYYLDDNKIYERKSIDETSQNFSLGIPITSSDVFVDQVVFSDSGSGWHSSSGNQPKVMMNLQFKAMGDSSVMILQTAVSQRNINVNK